MNLQELMALFNKQPRICALATANELGEVNVPLLGSPRMIDENTVIMEIEENRSFQNLRRNPKAVFLVMVPDERIRDWIGARVYLEVVHMETEGGFYDQIKQTIARVWGRHHSDPINAAIRFRITEVRPIF